jgi:hypothetical protein
MLSPAYKNHVGESGELSLPQTKISIPVFATKKVINTREWTPELEPDPPSIRIILTAGTK